MARPRRTKGGANRTGTTRWLRLRRATIRQAQRDGQTTCPECNQAIIWEAHPHHPKAPQVDHRTPYALGGRDEPDNLRVICRACNQRLGGKLGKKRATQHAKPAKSIAFNHDHW